MLFRIIRRFLPSAFVAPKAAGTQNVKKIFEIYISSRTYDIAPHHSSLIDSVRLYSEQVKHEELIVDYEQVKKATINANTLIIDVREPDEVKEHGKIPNSINIPLGNVTPVLGTMSEKEFQEVYKRPKPADDTEIIFYCMIGKRSGMAQKNAVNLGFKNTKNYVGSWTDWAAKSQ